MSRTAPLSDPIQIRHLSVPRRMRYAVRGNEEDPDEIWFVLHGYGQLAHRFLRYFADLDDGTRLLVAPEGLHRHYLDHAERKVGASWMTSEDRLTDIDDYVGWLDRLHARIAGAEPGPRGVGEGGAAVEEGGALVEGRGSPGVGSKTGCGVPVVTLGFSQGVHTLSRWLAFGRAGMDHVVLWGAPLPPDLEVGEHLARFRGPRLTLVAGEGDPHFGPDVLAATEERLAGHGIPFRTIRFPGGHRIDRSVLARIADGGPREG